MKKIITLLVVLTFHQFSFFAQTNVSVDPSITFQKMQGWGVSVAWWANLVGGMPQSSIDSITKEAAVDLNLNVFRFNIGAGENPNCTSGNHIRKDGGDMPGYRAQHADNSGWGTCDLNNDWRQIKVMDNIAKYRKDIITEVFSNSPPWWMTYSKCAAGGVNGTENIDANFIDDFADYLASTTAALINHNPAWNIKYIAPFNEPLSNWWTKGGSQEGCYISTGTQATTLWRLWQSQSTYGISALGRAAADCNTVPESLTDMTNIKTNNPGEYDGINVINTHSYDGTWQDKANLFSFAQANGNKTIWQSETGPLSWSPSDGQSWWQGHYMIGYRMIEDLRNLQCPVWCDWQLMSVDEGWGALWQTNFDGANPYKAAVYQKTRGYYCRKNVTNFLKAGYQIISTSDGCTIAGLDPTGTEVVFVIANQDGFSKTYSVDFTKFQPVISFKTFRTSGGYTSTDNCTQKTISSVTGKGIMNGNILSYTAPAFSVTTFIIKTGNPTDVKESECCERISVQPNPFSSLAILKSDYELKNAELLLFNIHGQEIRRVKNISGTEIIIERENLPEGIYFFKILENETEIAKGKIIIAE